jgi:hypothetical protein
MEEPKLDVNKTEETVAEPSTAENTAETISEDVKTPGDNQEQSVPYTRFKEVNDERQTLKELLAAKDTIPSASVELQAQQLSDQTGQTYEESLKVVKNLVKEEVDGRFSKLQNQMDLRDTMTRYPDFVKLAPGIKDLIKESPHLTWEQAYKLVKVESQPQPAAVPQQTKTKTAETGGKSKSVADFSDQEIDVFAKGPDGKYLYSLEEIADALPKG